MKKQKVGARIYLQAVTGDWQTMEQIHKRVTEMVGGDFDSSNMADIFNRFIWNLAVECKTRFMEPGEPNYHPDKEITEYRLSERLRSSKTFQTRQPLQQRVIEVVRSIGRRRRWWDRLI